MTYATALSTSLPSAEGVAASGIEAFLDAVEAAKDVELHSLMVLRHGHVVASGWWRPYTPERLHLLYSLSKSFTSTAAGLAVTDGLIRLDDPVIVHFPEIEPEVTDPRSRSMLVRHLASMSTGHREDTWQRVMAAGRQDPVRAFLLLAPDEDPGTVFAYNQSATYTLGAIVQRVTGLRMTDYLRTRILDPLGAGETRWARDPTGRDLGFSGLHATTDTIARLGELYLRGGSWRGRQLLSPAWVAEATRRHISSAMPGSPASMPNPDWQQGYGFQFWMSRHGFRGDGAYGQYCLVLPDQDAVIAITGQSWDMQAVLDAVWSELLPALGGTGSVADRAGDASLQDRLDRLALPVAETSPVPVGGDERWVDAVFEPASRTAGEQLALSARVSRHPGGWQISLEKGDWRLDAALRSDWVTSSPGTGRPPVASSGGWQDQDSMRLDLVFLETPHRLVVNCTLADHAVHAHWTTAPLHPGGLSALRAPGA